VGNALCKEMDLESKHISKSYRMIWGVAYSSKKKVTDIAGESSYSVLRRLSSRTPRLLRVPVWRKESYKFFAIIDHLSCVYLMHAYGACNLSFEWKVIAISSQPSPEFLHIEYLNPEMRQRNKLGQ
jgi:hypothetical protein